jgi:hypothetical protein
MDVDPMEHVEDASEKKSRLNAMVAVTIALLATFLGICKVKDDNICQAMQAAQTDRLDAWSAFNTKSTEAKVLEGQAVTLEFEATTLNGAAKAQALDIAKKAREHSDKEAKDKDDWQKKAKDAEDSYKSLNDRDDQFDLSDALCAMAISLMAITALTQKTFLYWFAMVPTFFGVLMGVAGLFSLKIHPDAITNLLSSINLMYWP